MNKFDKRLSDLEERAGQLQPGNEPAEELLSMLLAQADKLIASRVPVQHDQSPAECIAAAIASTYQETHDARAAVQAAIDGLKTYVAEMEGVSDEQQA